MGICCILMRAEINDKLIFHIKLYPYHLKKITICFSMTQNIYNFKIILI